MGGGGGLAVVERLLLAVVAIVAVLEVVLGERGPGSVVAPLGGAGRGAREEERIRNVAHASAEGVPPQVVAPFATRRKKKRNEGTVDSGCVPHCYSLYLGCGIYQGRLNPQ